MPLFKSKKLARVRVPNKISKNKNLGRKKQRYMEKLSNKCIKYKKPVV